MARSLFCVCPPKLLIMCGEEYQFKVNGVHMTWLEGDGRMQITSSVTIHTRTCRFYDM